MLLDTLQTNTTIISKTLCVDGQKLWRWYRDSLSGFTDKENREKQYINDIEVKRRNSTETIRVPILKPENIGANMAIDEKQIGEEMHTVLSNRETGKIAMLARSIVAKDLSEIAAKISDKLRLVKTLTRDLSSTYKKFGNESFTGADHIADKFHIIRDITDACQAVRIRYRQESLRDKRIKYEEFKKQEQQRKEKCKKSGKVFNKRKFKYKDTVLSNGDTVLQALARSRYQLFKFEKQWTPTQKQRASALFDKFPEIKTIYQLTCEFRNWMKKDNIGKDITMLSEQIKIWFKKVQESNIEELLNFKSRIERNLQSILNYFRFGATNAIAENINSRIQRFVMINQGTRDREFFYFRLANYFS